MSTEAVLFVQRGKGLVGKWKMGNGKWEMGNGKWGCKMQVVAMAVEVG